MKIVIIDLMPYPYVTGGGNAHKNLLAKTLMKKGHEVHIISGKARAGTPMLEYPKGVKLHNVGLPHKKFERKNGSFIVQAIYRVLFEGSFILGAMIELIKIKPDVANAQSLITTALPCSLTNIPFVATLHGIHSDGFKKIHTMNKNWIGAGLGSQIYFMIERFNMLFCKKLICHGKWTVEFYQQFVNKEKIMEGKNAIDTDAIKPVYKRKANELMYLARFTRQKGVEHLVEAMKFLPNFKLWLIGYGELKERLEKMKGKNVVMVDGLKDEPKQTLVRQARFTVLPSEFEAFSIALLEGMARGTIPVTTQVGGPAEIIQDEKNGFFLKSNDPKVIAEKIKQISKRKDLDTIAHNARKTIEDEWSIEVVTAQYLKAYKEAIRH